MSAGVWVIMVGYTRDFAQTPLQKSATGSQHQKRLTQDQVQLQEAQHRRQN